MMTLCAFDDTVVRMWNYDRETPDRRLWCDAGRAEAQCDVAFGGTL